MCMRLLLLNTTTGNTFHYMLKALIVHNIKWIVAQNKSMCIFQGSSSILEKKYLFGLLLLLCTNFLFLRSLQKNDFAHVISLCVQLFYDVEVYIKLLLFTFHYQTHS